MKEQQLRQYDPNSVVSDLRRRLDDIIARERHALEAQLDATRKRAESLSETDPDAAQQRANEARVIQEMEELVAERQALLDQLPRQVGETIHASSNTILSIDRPGQNLRPWCKRCSSKPCNGSSSP